MPATTPFSTTTFLNRRSLHRSTTSRFAAPHSHLRHPNPRASSWSASEIAEATGGEVVKWGPQGSISTDTRTLKQGQWFFAIAGERFDGHEFVTRELGYDEIGCVGVVGNSVCGGWRRGFVRVEGCTLAALEKMARYARRRFSGVVVGLTGSVGKTTTRVMTALALENLGQVYQTEGNRNNSIGVALTLIGMPRAAKASILELGMSRKGDILELERMCQPNVRVVLNVGHAHMANFGSLEEVANAKGELLMEAKPGDVCVMNADDPLVMDIHVPNEVKKVFFGRRAERGVLLVLAENLDGGSAFRLILQSHKWPSDMAEMVELKIHGPGLHLAMDACAAAAVAVSLGLSLSQVADSLSRFRPVSMRSELEVAENGIRIINDAYNANLASMIAAINMLKSIDFKGKRIAVLGDMQELGETAAHAHVIILNYCHDACFDLVAIAGENFIASADKLHLLGSSSFIFALNAESLADKIIEMVDVNDVVLVKGSRGMQMEKVVEAIKMINCR